MSMKNMAYKDFSIIEKNYELAKLEGTDIYQHLPVLYSYALQSKTIVEFGVRKIISTWAFLLGIPEKLICVDIKMPSYYLKDNEEKLHLVQSLCQKLDIEFEFIKNSTLNIEQVNTDLLFIDTLHTYNQLFAELNLHGNGVKKWIICHDTETFGGYITNSIGEKQGGLKYAIDDFLKINNQWKIKKVYENNNGLTVLERK